MMIETSRTLLRPLVYADSEVMYSYRSDAETNKYQGWIPKSIGEVQDFIKKIPEEFNLSSTWFQLGIVERASQELVGDLGIYFVDHHQCELGITLRMEVHGRGYATEVLKAVMDYLFAELGKHRITTSLDPLNTPSIKLVERLGFRKEAHFRQSLLVNGSWVDDLVYAVLRDEWVM